MLVLALEFSRGVAARASAPSTSRCPSAHGARGRDQPGSGVAGIAGKRPVAAPSKRKSEVRRRARNRVRARRAPSRGTKAA